MKNDYTYSIIIIGFLFFIFGFVTWLNGILISFLKIVCELESDTQSFFVTFAFYMAYFFLAIPSSHILKITGFKKGMALGLLIMALGSLLFIPAANLRNFGLFLLGLFMQGMGLAVLQTASNPYISVLGPMESAAKRISIMGICNKVAGILSPLVLGILIFNNIEEVQFRIVSAVNEVEKNVILDELASKIIIPYWVMVVILVLLAIIIFKSTLPEIEGEDEEIHKEEAAKKISVLQFPHLVLGVVALFLYVGVEVMAGDAIGIYGQSMGLPLDETKYFTSFTLFAMLGGYVLGIFAIPRYISQQRALVISSVLGVIFTMGVFLSSGYLVITFIALLGLANALIWPSIFPLAIDGLGKFTKVGSALLVMGIAGGAVLPLIYTILKDNEIVSNQNSFLVVMLPSYLFILYYALRGYIAGKNK